MEQHEPIFYDIDPRTGQATPTSLASVRAVLSTEVPLSPEVPKGVADNLSAAIDRIGMAYERANAGDRALFGLYNDAMICIGRALEVALKDRLGRRGGTLEQLTRRAIDEGLLREEDRDWAWLLRRLRNSSTHDEAPHGGPPVAATMLRQVARAVNRMYDRAGGT
jgi:hypothetical protein